MASGKGRGTGVADLTRRHLIDTPPPSRAHIAFRQRRSENQCGVAFRSRDLVAP
jgi:hypothetical protein